MLANYIDAIDSALPLHGSTTGLLLAENGNALPRGFALLVKAAGRRTQAIHRHVSQIALMDECETPVRRALNDAVRA
jgi:hypothetical protein